MQVQTTLSDTQKGSESEPGPEPGTEPRLLRLYAALET